MVAFRKEHFKAVIEAQELLSDELGVSVSRPQAIALLCARYINSDQRLTA